MTDYHISDKESFSEVRALIYEDNAEFSLKNNTLMVGKDVFTFSKEYSFLTKELEYKNDLIFGKDKTLEIVAIEVVDDEIVLFKLDGSVEKRPARFWLLCNRMLDSRCKRLEGNTHYKYIRFFSTFQEFGKYMNLWRKDNVYGIWNPREQVMTLEGITLYKGLKPSNLGVLAFDIESEGLTHHKGSEVYLITNSYEKDGVRIRKHFRVDLHSNDCRKMIDAWCEWVREIDPDILNFWNGYGYDLPYLQHVAKLKGTTLRLGRDGSEVEFKKKVSQKRVDGNTSWDYYKAHVYGRQIIDGLFVALNYGVGKGYPSWGLKPIAEAEGFVSPDRQFYDASKIKDNWHIPEEREKIIQYGIDDSEDTLNLFYRMITSYFYTCQSLAIPFEEMMQGATGKWVNSVLVRGYLQNGESVPKASDPERVAGGMSYGIPGVYSNVLKYDAASYYPSTILKFNIHNKEKDPNNYFVQTVKYFTEGRLKNKKLFKETGDKYYDDLQAAGKIFINSSYGVLATSGLNFNSFEHAAEITRCCRAGLQKAVIWATGKDINQWWEKYEEAQDYKDFSVIDKKTNVNFYNMKRHDFLLVNLDTDSLSFCKKDQSEFSEEEKETIEKEINDIMYCNWEDDGEFGRVVVLKAKNYVLLPKGETKFKVKGSSLTDSKKEPALREFMNKVVEDLVFSKNELLDIYENYTKEILSVPDISRWAVKKSITKKLLEGTRKNETNVLDALGDISQYREGDKVYIYNAINGVRPKLDKEGNEQYYKAGKNKGQLKTEDNTFLKLIENWNPSDFDKVHYLQRLTDTLSIFESVIDLSLFPDYNKPDVVFRKLKEHQCQL